MHFKKTRPASVEKGRFKDLLIEGENNMDIFKQLGITVGAPSLIQETKTMEVSKGDQSQQIVRKGGGISAREMLEGQLNKGFSLSIEPISPHAAEQKKTDHEGALKNTHGEDWHEDNDKQVEEFLSSAEEVDREFDGESRPSTSTPRHPSTMAVSAEKQYGVKISNKSFSMEELFLKGLQPSERAKASKAQGNDRLEKGGPGSGVRGHHTLRHNHGYGEGTAVGQAISNERSKQRGGTSSDEYNMAKLHSDKMTQYMPDPKGVHVQSFSDKDLQARNPSSGKAHFSKDKKTEHKKVLRQLKEMPKPNLPKSCDAKKSELDELVDLIKSDKISMPKKEFVAEHKKLVGVLNSPSHKDDKKEAKEQAAELKQVEKGGRPMPKMGPTKHAPAQAKDPLQAKQERQQKKELLGKWAKKSTIDEVLDGMINFGSDPYADNPEMIANIHDNSEGVTEKRQPPQLQKGKFIKSIGPGGIIFDFGNVTGNPLADRATALLNQNADRVQASSAAYQHDAYAKAMENFVKKGEQKFMQETSMFDNVESGVNLDKSFDQQVKEAYEKGQLNDDPSRPAVMNQFNETTMNLNGQVIKATSETDAAIIEMMKGQVEMPTDGMIADATTGGRISVVAGEPLPEV